MSTVRSDERVAEAVRTIAHASRLLEHDCEQAGITLAQYRLLEWVRIEPVRAGELATKAAISRPSLTTSMDTLVARGLILRDRVPGDRRGVSLELTDAGLAALRAVEDSFAVRLAEIVRPAEMKPVLSGLAVLREGLLRRLAAAAKKP